MSNSEIGFETSFLMTDFVMEDYFSLTDEMLPSYEYYREKMLCFIILHTCKLWFLLKNFSHVIKSLQQCLLALIQLLDNSIKDLGFFSSFSSIVLILQSFALRFAAFWFIRWLLRLQSTKSTSFKSGIRKGPCLSVCSFFNCYTEMSEACWQTFLYISWPVLDHVTIPSCQGGWEIKEQNCYE